MKEQFFKVADRRFNAWQSLSSPDKFYLIRCLGKESYVVAVFKVKSLKQ